MNPIQSEDVAGSEGAQGDVVRVAVSPPGADQVRVWSEI